MESCKRNTRFKNTWSYKSFPSYFGSNKYERHVALDPGHGGGWLVVALDLDPHHAALVDNLLDEPTVFSDHLADQTPGNLESLFRLIQTGNAKASKNLVRSL